MRKAAILALATAALATLAVGVTSYVCQSTTRVITGDVLWWTQPGYANYPYDGRSEVVAGIYRPFVLGDEGDDGLIDVHVYRARLCVRWVYDTLERWTQMTLPPFRELDGLWGFTADFGTAGLILSQADDSVRPVRALTIRVPLWVPFLVLSAYPVLAFVRGPVRRWRRRKRGLCAQCGYNLTGLTEPRCPECGERI